MQKPTFSYHLKYYFHKHFFLHFHPDNVFVASFSRRIRIPRKILGLEASSDLLKARMNAFNPRLAIWGPKSAY